MDAVTRTASKIVVNRKGKKIVLNSPQIIGVEKIMVDKSGTQDVIGIV